MAPDTSALTTKVASGSPYQLDPSQTLKASSALLKHIQISASSQASSSPYKRLLPADDDDDESLPPTLSTTPIWLILTTKKHIISQPRLKPSKIPLPHPYHHPSPPTTICLITADPQRPFKDALAHPTSPSPFLASQTRVLGLSKLKARYKSFESRRQLLSEYDVFLADDRVITMLPNLLGKIFYRSIKRPIPVNLQAPKEKKDPSGKRTRQNGDGGAKPVASPAQLAHEITRAVSCAAVHLAPGVTTAVRVGMANMSTDQVAENVEAVVKGVVEKHVTKGWRGMKSVHIKGPETMALPIWLADELWVDEGDVLEDGEEPEEKKRLESRKEGKKRKADQGDGQRSEGGEEKKRKKRKMIDIDGELSAEMRERRAKLREQKQIARGEGEVESKAITVTEVEKVEVLVKDTASKDAKVRKKKRKTVAV